MKRSPKIELQYKTLSLSLSKMIQITPLMTISASSMLDCLHDLFCCTKRDRERERYIYIYIYIFFLVTIKRKGNHIVWIKKEKRREQKNLKEKKRSPEIYFT